MATLVHQDGARQSLPLRRVEQAERPGMYSGQFTAVKDGDYRIELPIPGTESDVLIREVRVRIPAREIEQPQRNDSLLADLARQTHGTYFVGLQAALGGSNGPGLASRLHAKDQVTYLPGSNDRDFQQRWMSWLLVWIAGALCLEWLLRRIHRLA
jgi:hypothetical protein